MSSDCETHHLSRFVSKSALNLRGSLSDTGDREAFFVVVVLFFLKTNCKSLHRVALRSAAQTSCPQFADIDRFQSALSRAAEAWSRVQSAASDELATLSTEAASLDTTWSSCSCVDGGGTVALLTNGQQRSCSSRRSLFPMLGLIYRQVSISHGAAVGLRT